MNVTSGLVPKSRDCRRFDEFAVSGNVERLVAAAAGTARAATALEIASNFVMDVKEARLGSSILKTLKNALGTAEFERLLAWASEYGRDVP